MCGASQYAFQLAEGLEGTRFHFTMMSLKEGPLAVEAKRRGMPIHVIGKRRTGDPLALLRVIRILREQQVDLVHTHTSNSNIYGVLASFFVPACRPVSTVHAYYEEVNAESIPSRSFLKPGYHLDLFLLRRAAQVISVSRSIRDRLVSDGLHPRLISVIPNGIDVQAYQAQARREEVRRELGVAEEEVLVGTAGRLAQVKNQALLLRAAQKALPEARNLRVVIFGEGPEEGNLSRLAADAGLSGHVVFGGWRTDLSRCLSAMDIFVLSSRSEAAPFVLLESMALEIPVVSTGVGGVPEMIRDGETGLLTEDGNVDQMAAAILHLAGDPEFRKNLARRGREFVERHFSLAAMKEASAEVYHRASIRP